MRNDAEWQHMVAVERELIELRNQAQETNILLVELVKTVKQIEENQTLLARGLPWYL